MIRFGFQAHLQYKRARSNFKEFFDIENKCHCAADWHARATRETAVVGESLAGLFVVETFLLEPELFDSYFAFDPSLWWNGQRLVAGAAERLRARTDQPKALYFASSEEPSTAVPAQKLADILSKDAPAHTRWHYEKMPAEHHSTIYHPAALLAFRMMLAPEPAVPSPSAQPAAGTGATPRH